VRQLELVAAFIDCCPNIPGAVQFNSETAFFTAVLICAVFHEFASAALFDCVRRTFSTGSHGRLHEQRNTETSGGEYMALKLALGFGQGAARCLLIPNTIASPHAGPSSYYADLCQNIPFYPTTGEIPRSQNTTIHILY